MLVNENVIGPAINPFQKLYYDQFVGSPSTKDLEKMSRHLKVERIGVESGRETQGQEKEG